MSKDTPLTKLLNGEDAPKSAVGYSSAITSSSGTSELSASDDNITSDTIFGIGSCTKMFTAATMLSIIEQEKYRDSFPAGLDTKLSHFTASLKERYPDSTFIQHLDSQDHYDDITLRDLLQHTHGMGTHTATMDSPFICEVNSDPEKIWTPSEVMNDKYIQKQWVRPNGEMVSCEYGKFTYSNTGYELAGMIIETAANKKYADVVRDTVINPLGLKHTIMHDEVQQQLDSENSKLARGYILHDGQLHEGKGFNHAFASGGIHSTPNDLSRFTQAFLTQDLAKSIFRKPETLAEMTKTADQGKGDGSFYGLGFRNIGTDGLIGHPGGIQGFESMAAYDQRTGEAAAYIYTKDESKTHQDIALSVSKEGPDITKHQLRVPTESSVIPPTSSPKPEEKGRF